MWNTREFRNLQKSFKVVLEGARKTCTRARVLFTLAAAPPRHTIAPAAHTHTYIARRCTWCAHSESSFYTHARAHARAYVFMGVQNTRIRTHRIEYVQACRNEYAHTSSVWDRVCATDDNDSSQSRILKVYMENTAIDEQYAGLCGKWVGFGVVETHNFIRIKQIMQNIAHNPKRCLYIQFPTNHHYRNFSHSKWILILLRFNLMLRITCPPVQRTCALFTHNYQYSGHVWQGTAWERMWPSWHR